MNFQNVMGLAEGAQILYEGYPVGHIEEISLARRHDASAHRLGISIREGWKIPEDSVAVITQSGFLSPVVVDILGGSSTRMLAPGDRIESQGNINLMTALASMSSKLGELTETSLKPLLDNLTEGTGSLENLFKDAPVISENLKRFTFQINGTTDRLNTLLDRSDRRIDTILADVETASGSISTLAADLRQTRERLDTLLVSINSLVSKNRENFDHSIADLRHTLEVVANHVRDISYNMEATTRNLSEFTSQIRRDPGVIIRGRGLNEDLATGE
jgi:phospholipid/cholesterol/gamma-HCH transport system substrate-binding protein